MDVVVKIDGPLFDQRYDQVIGEFLDAAKTDIAEVGENMMAASSAVFRYEAKPRTGVWLANLHTSNQGDDLVIEDDAVYNAWLEGVGSRNKTTRFKGYRIWRLTAQQLQAAAAGIAERTLQRFIGRLGG